MWKNTIKEKSVFAVTLLTLSFLTTTALQFFFNISVVIYVVLLSAVLGVGFSYLLYFTELKKQKKGGGRGKKYYQEENKVNDLKMAY